MSFASVRTEERIPIAFNLREQKLFGLLHLPLGDHRVPAVVLCHGLASNKCGRYRFYVHLAERLASMGIAALRFDFRGCGDSEGDFSQVTLTSQVEDTCAALAELKNHSKVDTSRLGIFGRSFGGLVALLTAQRTKAFQSAAVCAAVFNGDSWRALWQLRDKAAELPHFNGESPSVTLFEELFQLDMCAAMNDLKTLPFLNIHGAKDVRVEPSHADSYSRCREGASAPSHFVLLPNSDHEFSHPAEREEALVILLDWFRQTL